MSPRAWRANASLAARSWRGPTSTILFYITAVVMPDEGSIHFAEDINGHDTKLVRALERRE
jgi:hypothetical protein